MKLSTMKFGERGTPSSQKSFYWHI